MADPSPQKPLTVLEGFKGFLLWVGGSLAGITAILYACGYLVTRAHLSMLGLYGLVDYGNDYFLQEGAKFLVTTGYTVVRTLLPLATGAAVLVVGWLLLRSMLGAARRSRWFSAVRERIAPAGLRARLRATGAWIASHHALWRRLFYVLLFVALVFHADDYLGAFDRPLSIENVLYAQPTSASGVKPGTAAEIGHWILSDARDGLTRVFEDLLFGAFLAAVLALFAWRTVRPWRQRAWLAAPFFAALLIYLVMLPMAYGVLERPIRYPVLSLATKEDTVQPKGKIFLLALTDRAFVVWSRDARKVVWFPVESVTRAEIRTVEDLFGRAASKDEEGAK